MSYRTPLARAQGLGAVKSGTHHWMIQRASAIALIPLVIWGLFAIVAHHDDTHAELTAWLASQINAVPLTLLLFAAFYHARLGLQVVIEDYIHDGPVKIAALLANNFATIGLMVASIFAVWKLAFGA